MIVRKDDYDGFKNFDFMNDTNETVQWLFKMGRTGEALELQAKAAERFREIFNYGGRRK